MDSQVEEIKKKLDIVDVINHYLPLKKRGRHYLAPCPFHSEKTPSFTVSPELQIFKCFGCGKAGDIFTFVQEYDHVDFKDALEDLAKMAGVTLKKDVRLSRVEHQRKRLVDLNYEIAKFYNYILTSHPLGKPALDYVARRHLTSDTIKLFRLGFSPPNPSLLAGYLAKKGFAPEELIKSGTFGKSNYGSRLYDRFQGRLVFPLADFRDRILGFSGRLLPGSSENAGKYINSPETDIYHKSQLLFGLNLAKEAIKKTNSVIIVEGEFDMISPYQQGIANIVAIKGTAFTSDQLTLLRRYTDRLILALDADFAGSNAARKSIELADSMEFNIEVLSLPEPYKDPDEAVTADPQLFKQSLAHPIPIWDFIINSALKNFDVTSVSGKKLILTSVLPFLAKINNSVIRSDYLNKFSAQIGSSLDSVVEESQKYISAPSPSFAKINSPSSSEADKVDLLENHLLTVILSSKKPHQIIRKILLKYQFNLPRFHRIAEALALHKGIFQPQKFAAKLPSELISIFQDLFLSASRLDFTSRQRHQEITRTVNQIAKYHLRQRLNSLSSQIAAAENSDSQDLVKKLESEYNQTLQQLSRQELEKN